jgi:Tfp pilus assembly protein PilN
MAENEGDSRFMTGFLLGFLVGVLICLGVGGTFFVVRWREAERQARDIMIQAEQSAQEAQAARELAELERIRAEKMLNDAKEQQK